MKNKTVLYIVHDLSDAAVLKRVQMFRDSSIDVILLGFCRDQVEPYYEEKGFIRIMLGRTYNGGFAQRIKSVLTHCMNIKKLKNWFVNADFIVARNLECLSIAVRGKSNFNLSTPMVYECLDIHRLMLRKDLIGKGLRLLERQLCNHVTKLITSSPAFINQYFLPIAGLKTPIQLVENKVYLPNGFIATEADLPAGSAWKIGWFGAIRCVKSFNLLTELARQNPNIEVVIRGRVSYDRIPHFDEQVDSIKNVFFHGKYKNPDDLERMYRSVHFTWAVDMYQEGLNSKMLLPNRIYEGGLYDSVPIVRADVETGRFLQDLGIGIQFETLDLESLNAFFNSLTIEKYIQEQENVRGIPKSKWIFDKESTQELIKCLYK